MNIHKLNARSISKECSPVHIENVIIDLVEALKISEQLMKQVLSINPKAGELGEGFANNLIEKATKLNKLLNGEL